MWPGLAFLFLSIGATERQGQNDCTNTMCSIMRDSKFKLAEEKWSNELKERKEVFH